MRFYHMLPFVLMAYFFFWMGSECAKEQKWPATIFWCGMALVQLAIMITPLPPGGVK